MIGFPATFTDPSSLSSTSAFTLFNKVCDSDRTEEIAPVESCPILVPNSAINSPKPVIPFTKFLAANSILPSMVDVSILFVLSSSLTFSELSSVFMFWMPSSIDLLTSSMLILRSFTSR